MTEGARAEPYDVVVIGAGLAGLAAAVMLAGAGRRVVVLEARDEVGGRVCSCRLDYDQTADLGAEWVGSRHHRVRRLASEAGVSPERTGFLGARSRWRATGVDVHRRWPPLTLREWLRLARVFVALDRLAARTDPVEPWSSPGSAELDATTFGAWLRERRVSGVPYELLDTLVGDLVSQSIERLSLLHVVWWVSRNGGALTGFRSAFEDRLPGGTQQLSRHLAARLDVRTGNRVVRLAQDATGVTARSDNGAELRGRLAVLALSAPDLLGIDHDPALPDGQVRLATELEIGSATKVAAVLRVVPAHAPRVVLGGRPLTACWRYGARVTGFARPPYDGAPEPDLVPPWPRPSAGTGPTCAT